MYREGVFNSECKFTGGESLLKYNIPLPLITFVFLTIKQLIFNNTVEWADNVGISVTIFLFYNLWEWASKSSKKNKND